MASEPDRLILSAKERQVLAELEEALHRDAPDLEATLATGRRSRVRARAVMASTKRRVAALPLPAQLAVAAALLVAGSLVMLLTFTSWLPVALIGTAAMAAGIWTALDAGHTLWRRRRSAAG